MLLITAISKQCKSLLACFTSFHKSAMCYSNETTQAKNNNNIKLSTTTEIDGLAIGEGVIIIL